MKQLTRTDWETINAALAYYEAEDAEAFGADTEAQQVAHFKQIERARGKVHERLARQAPQRSNHR